MPNWTRWQKFAFLGYLLLLNMIVLGTFAYVAFSDSFWPQSTSGANLATALPAPLSSATAFSWLAPSPSHLNQDKRNTLKDNLTNPTPTATFLFDNSSTLVLIEATVETYGATYQLPARTAPRSGKRIHTLPTPRLPGDSVQAPARLQSTSIDTLRSTSSPTSQSTATATRTPTPPPTSTPQPTTIPTAPPTRVPPPSVTPTPTSTHTPQPTATTSPTATFTYTPRPTATSTRTVTSTPTQTRPPTPRPQSRNHSASLVRRETAPISVAALALENQGNNTTAEASIARLALPDQPLISGARSAKAVAVTRNSIALQWTPSENNAQYRVYSDMGRGYGAYIYKAHTMEPTFIDELLQPQRAYHYRIAQVDAGREVTLAQTRATISGNIGITPSLARKPQLFPIDLTPAPTALPPDTVLLGLLSDNYFTDDFNVLTIAGEVRNDSSLDVGKSEIAITFYNGAGAVIDTAKGKTMLKTLSPGEISPFLITLPHPAGMVSYSLRAVARPTSPKLSAQLSIIKVRRFEDDAGFFHVKGIVKNIGDVASRRVKVAATIYSRDGRVINVGFTALKPNLTPGETVPYDIVFTYYPRYVTQAVIPFEE